MNSKTWFTTKETHLVIVDFAKHQGTPMRRLPVRSCTVLLCSVFFSNLSAFAQDSQQIPGTCFGTGTPQYDCTASNKTPQHRNDFPGVLEVVDFVPADTSKSTVRLYVFETDGYRAEFYHPQTGARVEHHASLMEGQKEGCLTDNFNPPFEICFLPKQ